MTATLLPFLRPRHTEMELLERRNAWIAWLRDQRLLNDRIDNDFVRELRKFIEGY